jgi:hypothetical protein
MNMPEFIAALAGAASAWALVARALGHSSAALSNRAVGA